MGIKSFLMNSGIAIAAFTMSACTTAQSQPGNPVNSWLASQNEVSAATEPRNAEVEKIHRQLIAYSGSEMPVLMVPDRSFGPGQAHGDKTIIFDRRDPGADSNLIAYRLAHEWGHEVLGHGASLYNPDGQGYRFQRSSQTEENAADNYAGTFLAEYGYDIGRVCRSLQVYSNIPWDSRTSGAERCSHVKATYQREIARRDAKGVIKLATR